MGGDTDRPGSSTAEVHILFNGYAKDGDTPTVSYVNACVILRRDNFDHPFVLYFLPVNNLQGSPSHLFCH